MRILVIDDDKSIVGLLQEALSRDHYAVDTAGDGEEGETLAESIPYDLIVLDIMLPKKGGLEICRSLREKKIETPIMMLTAKTTDLDIIHGLDCGADDYLIKPFRIGVLAARVRALLRRKPNFAGPAVEVGDLVIDTVGKKVLFEGKEIVLTAKEYAIVEYLAYHSNAVVTRSDLEQHIWNLELDSSSNVVDEHIKNLRRKLQGGIVIDTVRGFGYRMNA